MALDAGAVGYCRRGPVAIGKDQLVDWRSGLMHGMARGAGQFASLKAWREKHPLILQGTRPRSPVGPKVIGIRFGRFVRVVEKRKAVIVTDFQTFAAGDEEIPSRRYLLCELRLD